MAQVTINFEVDETLKADFEKAIKKARYSTMSEAFREFMRSLVARMGTDNNAE